MATTEIDLGSVVGPVGPKGDKGDQGPIGPQGPAADTSNLVKKSGDTMSGNLTMADGKMVVVNSNGISVANPSGTFHSAYMARVSDAEGNSVASVQGEQYSSGTMCAALLTRHMVNDALEMAYFGPTLSKEGLGGFRISHPAELRRDIGLRSGRLVLDTQVPSGSYEDHPITFSTAMKTVPHIATGIYSQFDGAGVGNMMVCVHTVTTTGFTLRIFNNDTQPHKLTVYYIAMDSNIVS